IQIAAVQESGKSVDVQAVATAKDSEQTTEIAKSTATGFLVGLLIVLVFVILVVVILLLLLGRGFFLHLVLVLVLFVEERLVVAYIEGRRATTVEILVGGGRLLLGLLLRLLGLATCAEEADEADDYERQNSMRDGSASVHGFPLIGDPVRPEVRTPVMELF